MVVSGHCAFWNLCIEREGAAFTGRKVDVPIKEATERDVGHVYRSIERQEELHVNGTNCWRVTDVCDDGGQHTFRAFCAGDHLSRQRGLREFRL